VLINQGRVTEFLIFFSFVVLFVYYYRRFGKNGEFSIRKLPAIETMEQAIGRATEMGRPVQYSVPQVGQVDAQSFASVILLGHVAKLCAKFRIPLNVGVGWQEMFPMADATVRSAYTTEGYPEGYKPDTVKFYGTAIHAAVLGDIARNEPAANFLIGGLGYETVLWVEAGARVGAMQVGGTMNTAQLPFIAAVAEGILIGSEMFVASAEISPNAGSVASVMADEVLKIAGLLFLCLGSLLATIGNQTLIAILKM
jgi:hypothetical protein